MQHFWRPIPLCQIEQDRACPTGAVARKFTGQLIAHVVFREQDAADFFPYLRFMLLHPQNLWGGKACQGVIAGDLNQLLASEFCTHSVALCTAALVIPQN